MSDKNISVAGGRFIGFFSLLMLLTLNASNGKDVLDVFVPWIEAQTVETLRE